MPIAQMPKHSDTDPEILNKARSSEQNEQQSNEEERLVPVPWKMRFSGDPKDYTITELIQNLGLSEEQVGHKKIEELAAALDQYKGLQQEHYARLSREMESAVDDLERQGKFFTRAEHEKYREAKRAFNPAKEAVTSFFRGAGQETKYFILPHKDHEGIAHIHEDIRENKATFKNSIYEILVGPVPERPVQEQK